ncbi:TlpA family protein disulfide reductase [Tenacibaculum sp. M341]|uniref:TlpA family protein disulfide reductase n=1 Tax=Tenacibaculum sp. M341 TaxID=2530339 RepID=UPI00104B9A41|nr:TlpA disulfide reductase family protein [Tenacibaculum sp. M341]TCI90167.1 TlpA family protein disulfide reductase [Tenacibaculum sp. M341]
MKKLVYLLIITVLVVSCKKKDYVTVSGKIANKFSDSLVIFHPQKGFERVINVDENGNFKDTLKVENGYFFLSDNKNRATINLNNSDEIVINFDANDFDKSLSFSGKGAAKNNFLLVTKENQQKLISQKDLYDLPKEEFDSKISAYVAEFNVRLNNKELDTAFVAIQKTGISRFEEQIKKMHAEKLYVKTQLAKGMPSPKFVNYEKPDRETVSLDDLKGKYVYIDVWATWCPPCKKEIPFLQKVEADYHDKNIEFVSISIDSKDDYFTWSDMVEEKQLSGIQLYANDDKSFTKAYRISEIPRFILVDPEGNIVSSEAPRPSDPKLVELFDSLEI